LDRYIAELGERMESMKEVKLLTGKAKKIEKQIVKFYATVGKMDGLLPKPTAVFAYLKIYDELSQEQLRRLSGFSLSTISTILQSFLQTDIIDRRMFPGTHKYLYKLKPERTRITYRPPTQIIESLEKLDAYVLSKQEDLRVSKEEHLVSVRFLQRRLNSLRNYVEAQRRAIYREKKFAFLEEDTSELHPLDEMIVLPFDTRELENKIMEFLILFRGDHISNRIISIFITHRCLDQDTLVQKTGFSRSTVSRYLRKALKGEYIRVFPKEHRKPRIYYLESVASSILWVVRKTDGFAFSQIPIFKEILLNLKSEQETSRGEKETAFLMLKCEETIRQLESFQKETEFFRKAHDELLEFLGKNVP